MRYAKLIGISLLATMVSVGCGQAPTMNADVSGYGGHKYGKKSNGSDSIRANVISDLNIGHRIDQNVDQEQTGQSNEQKIKQKQIAIAIGAGIPVVTPPAIASDTFPNIEPGGINQSSEQSNTNEADTIENEATVMQDSSISDADIENQSISLSNTASQIQGDENAVGLGGGNGGWNGWSSYKKQSSSKKRSR